MPRERQREARRPEPAIEARQAGFTAVRAHPLFGPLLRRAHPKAVGAWGMRATALQRGGLLAVDAHGGLVFDGRARAEVDTWTWSLCHVLAHLGFGHADPAHRDGRGSYTPEWRAACCLVVDRFLGVLRIPGTPVVPPGLDDDVRCLARRFASDGIPAPLAHSPAGAGPDLWEDLSDGRRSRPAPSAEMWGRTFAIGLGAVEGAVGAAGQLSLGTGSPGWAEAVEWFSASSPMLGALADGLKVVEDVEVCRAGGIGVAAVCAASGEVYLNPTAVLSQEERRFVLGHQLLHAGLRHDSRRGRRHPELYNVAADFVINGWLLEMRLGTMPAGCLHSPMLANRSVDEVYDGLARDMRHFRELAASPGICVGDVLQRPVPRANGHVKTVDLDGFYRRALTQGLDLHKRLHRGFVPPLLEAEIRTLSLSRS